MTMTKPLETLDPWDRPDAMESEVLCSGFLEPLVSRFAQGLDSRALLHTCWALLGHSGA